MATSGRKSKVDLFVEVPAAGRHFLHTVEIAPSSSTTVGAAHVTHEQLAQALVEGKLLPPEARYQFLREDGSPIENRLTEMVPGEGAILRLTRAPDVRPPDLSPIMVGSEPRAHAPSVCRSLRSGAEINIPVQAATGTSLECIIPRQKALDLGLHCLLEDVNEGFDYFGLVNCKIPGNMMLHGSRPHEGLESLLHVYCSKHYNPDTPFFANTLIIGFPGVIKMGMSINYGVSHNQRHPRPCPYRCCNNDVGLESLIVRTCDSCGSANENLQRCPCRTVSYCDEVCQRRHWRAGHKRVCSARVPSTVPAH